MSDRLTSVQELLLQASEIEDFAKRSAFLVKACGADSVLRREVEELLQAQAAAGRFLPDDPGDPSFRAALLGLDPPGAFKNPFSENPGDSIGRYKLLQKLGEGGCGVVYMAEQQEPLRRKVALKVIKLGMDTRNVVARFEAERQALALMDHPNIAKVLDAGATETGRPFFVMELVRGAKLTEYCDENGLSARQRLELFIQVCHGIQHAHQKGIIHRDLKPSNILVTVEEGLPIPKIIDFGIAKATEGRLTDRTLFTAFEQFLGTPAYMSPEQAAVSSTDVDTRSDIYSLGVLLYELLTGKTPFNTQALLASGLDELRRTIIDREPPRPSTCLSSLSQAELTLTAHRRGVEPPKLIHYLRGDLDWIVMKCLEKNRSRRYETANAFAADLKRHLNHEPVLARPPSALYEFQKSLRRHWVGFAAAAAVLLALAGGILMSTFEALRARQAEASIAAEARRARSAEKLAAERSTVAQRERDRAEANLYAADMLLAQRARDESNLGLAVDFLNKHRTPAGMRDFRGWEWRYLWTLCRSDELFTLERHPGSVSGLAFSSDGMRLATASTWEDPCEGEVRLVDFTARRPLTTLWKEDPVGSVGFSSDGSMVAFGTLNHGVIVWDLKLERQAASLPVRQKGRIGAGLAFCPGEHVLALGDSRGGVSVWDIDTQEKRFAVTGHRGPVAAVLFGSDRKTLISAGRDGFVRFWNIESGKKVTEFRHPDGIQAVALSADGRTLVSGGWEGRLRVWDTESHTQIAVLTNHTAWISSVVLSPDGKMLASASADHTLRLWDTSSWQELDVLRGHHDEVASLAFSPDGLLLLSGAKDGEVKAWSSVPRPRPVAFVPWQSDFCDFALASDATACAVLHSNSTVSLLEIPALQEVCRQVLSDPTTNIIELDLAAGGRRIAYLTKDGSLIHEDLKTGSASRSIRQTPESNPVLRFSPSGKLLVLGGASPWLHFFEADSLRLTREVRREDTAPVRTLSFSNNGELLAAGTRDGTIEIWDLPHGHHLTLRRHRGLSGLALLPDGASLISVGSDATIRSWDISSSQQRLTLGKTLNTFNSIASAPDGLRVVTSDNSDALTLWDPQTGLELARLPGNGATQICFSADGSTIVAGSSQGLHVWCAPSWEEIATAERSRPSPTGR